MPAITIMQSRALHGRVSTGNTKMPGTSFATDPFACAAGSRLARIENSVCGKCYARRLAVFRKNVAASWERNLSAAITAIEADPEAWATGIAKQIRHALEVDGENRHRWFDAGDLPSLPFLRAIVRVAELTPEVRHWLPTREAGIVRNYLRQGGTFPPNLVVRVSAPLIDDKPLTGFAHGSTVHRERRPDESNGEVICRAKERGNKCGPCDACWNPAVKSVSYPLH